jgi:hypothetical protein
MKKVNKMTGTISRNSAGTALNAAFRAQAPLRPESARKLVDVEWLIEWTYRLQLADKMSLASDVRTYWPSVSACGVAAVQRVGHLGVTVDSFGPAFGGSVAVHVDASLVHDVVTAMGGAACGLVIKHGRTGTRPDFLGDGPSRFVPAAGAPLHSPIVENYDKRRNRIAPYCPVIWHDAAESIVEARRRYGIWHAALAGIAEDLVRHVDRLKSHQVTGFAAPARPWQ